MLGSWRLVVPRVHLVDIVEEHLPRSHVTLVFGFHLRAGLRAVETVLCLAQLLEGEQVLCRLLRYECVLESVALDVEAKLAIVWVGRGPTRTADLCCLEARPLSQVFVFYVIEAVLADTRGMEGVLRVAECHVEEVARPHELVAQHRAGPGLNLGIVLGPRLLERLPLEGLRLLRHRRRVRDSATPILFDGPRLSLYL